MALQGSGQISIGNIATEFGDAAPNAMSEFYGAGGAPSSGELRISDFYGLSNAPEFSYLGTWTGTSNTTTINITNVSFGTATSTRKIAIFITNGSNTTLSSASIGGVGATVHFSTQSSAYVYHSVYAISATVPTGTTGTVSLTFSGGYPDFSQRIWVFRLDGLDSGTARFAAGLGGNTSITQNVTAPSGSAVMVFVGQSDANTASPIIPYTTTPSFLSQNWRSFPATVSGGGSYISAGVHSGIATSALSNTAITSTYDAANADSQGIMVFR